MIGWMHVNGRKSTCDYLQEQKCAPQALKELLPSRVRVKFSPSATFLYSEEGIDNEQPARRTHGLVREEMTRGDFFDHLNFRKKIDSIREAHGWDSEIPLHMYLTSPLPHKSATLEFRKDQESLTRGRHNSTFSPQPLLASLQMLAVKEQAGGQINCTVVRLILPTRHSRSRLLMPSGRAGEASRNIWVGSEGVTASAHFDQEHNMLVQVCIQAQVINWHVYN